MTAVAVLGWSSPTWSQPQPNRPAGEVASASDLRYTVHFASESGVQAFVPEKWGELRISLTNSRAEPRDVLCSTYFGTDASLQYGRRIWMPARSTLRVEHPIYVPKYDRDKGRNLPLHSFLFDHSTSTSKMVRSEGGELRHDGALIVTHDLRNTAIIGKPALGSDLPRDEVADLVAACRVQIGLPNTLTFLQDAFLPADEAYLNALDHIVLADGRVVEDLAAMTALRRWLHAGGHLWVTLDRVEAGALGTLLGDDFCGHVVDRVGLTSVRVDEVTESGETPGEVQHHDDPVEFVRLSVENVNVSHRINGWPAAMTLPCGDGKLLITTLGARGWMKPWLAGKAKSPDPSLASDFLPTESMSNVADEFFRLREPDLLPPSAMERQVQEYIGYGIMPWGLIVGTLLGFCAAIVVIGVVLLRRGLLEHLGWIGSLLALGVSLFTIQAGRLNRQAAPATLASTQLVQAIRGTDDLRSDGLLATYQPEGSDFPIATTLGGRLIPDMSGLESTSRRMVMTDLGAAHWENLRQPAGVRSASFKYAESVPNRLAAYLTFHSQGVQGQYVGELPPGTDAVLATRDGRLGITWRNDGAFVGRGEDVFEEDQYLSAGLLSDEQDRRRRTLQEVFDNPNRTDYPGLPQLMFWSGPRDNGFRFGDGLMTQGSSLIAVPLIMERPANGTQIMIPSPLLSYVNRRNPDGTQSSSMWNPQRREWQERSSPALAWLTIQVPRELTPVAARRMRIHLKVTGPVGRIEFLGLKDGAPASLATMTDPVGVLSVDITDPHALTIDQEGRLALGLSAGDPDRPHLTRSDDGGKVNYWKIESLALELWATTIEPVAKD